MTQYNAAERKDVRKAEKAAKLADRQRAEIVSGIMSVAPGRAWMLDRLESASVFATTFNPDALQMAFAEGNRNQGLQLLNDIMQHCPEQYVLMMRERNERDAARSTPSERAGSQEPDGGDIDSPDSTGSDAAGEEGRSSATAH